MHIQLDVSDEESWKGVIARIDENYNAMHILVNNAGVSKRYPLEELSRGGVGKNNERKRQRRIPGNEAFNSSHTPFGRAGALSICLPYAAWSGTEPVISPI